jgi:hypothetical protein
MQKVIAARSIEVGQDRTGLDLADDDVGEFLSGVSKLI